MERQAYRHLENQENTHWWFVGRRAIAKKLITTQVPLPEHPKILDVGCGTGGNLSLLSEFGAVDAFEADPEAMEIANLKRLANVEFGRLPDQIPSSAGKYDLVTMFDVLEHIEQDTEALSSLIVHMTDNGRILITVPAMPWLWSSYDEIHHHKRRYTRKSLKSALNTANFKVCSIGYFNTILFPAAIIQRVFAKSSNSSNKIDEDFPQLLNRMFRVIFRLEKHFIPLLPMPFGLSLFAIAIPIRQKNNDFKCNDKK